MQHCRGVADKFTVSAICRASWADYHMRRPLRTKCLAGGAPRLAFVRLSREWEA